ncbi:hypothetical protein Tco_0345386 [Tanacetum coccineum]
MLIIKCEKTREKSARKEKKKKKKIFGVLITQNPAAVFRRSPEFAPSDRHNFWIEASLHIKESCDRWDLDFEAWKFCFLPGQIASCLVIFFLSCSLFVAIFLDIDFKIMMIVPSSAPQTFASGNEVVMRNRRGKQGHGTRDTRHRTRDTGHGTRKTENGKRNTEHGTRNTEYGIRNPRTQSPDPRTPGPGPRTPEPGPRNPTLDPRKRNPEPDTGPQKTEPGTRHRTPENGTRNPTPDPRKRNQEPGTQNTRKRDTGYGTRYTGYETRDTEHGTWNTEQGIRNTEHGTRNTEHGTRNTKQGTRNPDPRTRSPEPDAGPQKTEPGTRHRTPENGTRNPEPETLENGTRDTGHGTRDTGHRTQDTEHGKWKTEHGTRNMDPRTPEPPNPDPVPGTRHRTPENPEPDPGPQNPELDPRKRNPEPDTGPHKMEPETRHWTPENGNPRKRNLDLKNDSDDDAGYEEAEQRRKGKMVVSDFQIMDGWSDLLGSSEALFRNGIKMDNSETSFRIHPFYIEKGSPSVGKTSLVLALGKFSGHSVVYVDELIEEDHLFICRYLHPSLSDCLLRKLIAFNKHLYEDTMRQFDFILDGLAKVPSNDRVFGQWLNALFQNAAFLPRLLTRGLFGVSSKTTSE